MDIEKILNGLTLYENNTKIKKEDQNKFFEFIRHLKSSRKVRFIYRGESNLNEQYGTDTRNISLLSQYVFMIGEKSRTFLENRCEYDNIFKFIWDKFFNKVCKMNFDSDRTKAKLEQFLADNSGLNDYFSNKGNRRDFIGNNTRSDKEQKVITDYYLALLHTIGKSGNARSHFLSSSTECSVADGFKDENGIILYGWIPRKGLKDKVISYEGIGECNDLIASFKLPIYQVPIYPEQKEICLKFGWLPHFIIGFQYQDRFYINPNALKPWRTEIVYDGLDVDQSGFIEIFNTTNYECFYLFIDGNYTVIDKGCIRDDC